MMKIKELGHLAFKCRDLEKSLHFYRDILGFPVKFCLYYADIGQCIPGEEERWIVYVQVTERLFIELFDGRGAERLSVPSGETFNYQHLSLIVEDIHAACEELKAKGATIDDEPSLGIDNTWQMWSHDPDGNKIEFMQYTEKSFQLVGRTDKSLD